MMAELLIKCGVNKNVAKVLEYLSEVNEATTREIELNCDLRQPEVSVTMKTLIDLGYIESKEVKNEKGKGRPRKVYKLTKPIKEIVNEIIEKKKEEIREIEETIRKLEELVK